MTIKETVAARMVANRARMKFAIAEYRFWSSIAESHAIEAAAQIEHGEDWPLYVGANGRRLSDD